MRLEKCKGLDVNGVVNETIYTGTRKNHELDLKKGLELIGLLKF